MKYLLACLVTSILIINTSCTKTIPCSECGSTMRGTNLGEELGSTIRRYSCSECSNWEVHSVWTVPPSESHPYKCSECSNWEVRTEDYCYVTKKGFDEYHKVVNESDSLMKVIQSSAPLMFDEKENSTTYSSDQVFNTWQIRYKVDDWGDKKDEPYIICTIPSIIASDDSTSTEGKNSHISFIVECNPELESSYTEQLFRIIGISEPLRNSDEKKRVSIQFKLDTSHSGPFERSKSDFQRYMYVEDIYFIRSLESPINVAYTVCYDSTIHGTATLPTKGFKETYEKFLCHPHVQKFINHHNPDDILDRFSCPK